MFSFKYIFKDWVDDIQVVPNATAINPNISGKLHQQKKGLTVTFLSNLFKNKGILDLLEASKIVIDKHPNVIFKIAGSWSNQEPETHSHAIEFLKRNTLEKKVEFVGVVSGKEKEKFLVETDLFVLPTWHPTEGQPNVIIEAMAAGCPIVSTKWAAIPETVIDGKTGLLVDPQNPAAIAKAILQLIENPSVRKKMSEASRKRYEQYYTQEKNIDNMIEVFEKTLEKNNP